MDKKICPYCKTEMRGIPLFTSVHYECPRCDTPEPIDPRADSDVLPDWNCLMTNEVKWMLSRKDKVSKEKLKELIQDFCDAYPHIKDFIRQRYNYQVK